MIETLPFLRGAEFFHFYWTKTTESRPRRAETLKNHQHEIGALPTLWFMVRLPYVASPVLYGELTEREQLWEKWTAYRKNT